MDLDMNTDVAAIEKKSKLDEDVSVVPVKISSSELSNVDDEVDMDDYMEEDDGTYDYYNDEKFNYIYDDDNTNDYNDDDYNDDEDDEDDYAKMQSQFDNVDLPPGVEASVPWLNSSDTTSSTSTSNVPHASKSKSSVVDTCVGENKGFVSSATGTSAAASKFESALTSSSAFIHSAAGGFAASKLGTVLTSSSAFVYSAAGSSAASKLGTALTSSSAVSAESSSNVTKERKETSQNDFKQFDVVNDFSDHHFRDVSSSEMQPPKNWSKRILEEWKILEGGLPDTIFVRAYEERMDLLRSVIIGPFGTPYHDGLFVFDCYFPPKYPDVPPMVFYFSGGLRLNPNLYECGKVCLSLLGTWSGQKEEMWIPGNSTMLQVLISIQALILNANPFFNEPGYETIYTGETGNVQSKKYNEDTFISSLKTMLYTMRRPPKHFEELVAHHFRNRARKILMACKAYREGATIGSDIADGNQNANDVPKSSTCGTFGASLGKMMKILLASFTKNGSTDCDQFQ